MVKLADVGFSCARDDCIGFSSKEEKKNTISSHEYGLGCARKRFCGWMLLLMIPCDGRT